jgi:hypothetical protein
MAPSVCVAARTFNYPRAGGHLWVYLNWVRGLQALGCEVLWLEAVNPEAPAAVLAKRLELLERRLGAFGLGGSLVLCSATDKPLVRSDVSGLEAVSTLDRLVGVDLLLDFVYDLPRAVLKLFRGTALLDIDPGLLQHWIAAGHLRIAPHDAYFTTGETVGAPGSRIPDCGLRWEHVRPCVSLTEWQPHPAPSGAPFTTVSSWYMDEWVDTPDGGYVNDKRSGFLPYLDLPSRTSQRLELALLLDGAEQEQRMLEEHGWRVRRSRDVACDPDSYREYIRGSRAEFSCAKPSCGHLQNAWISDRTLCYLASGKPAVVEHTGPSRFLPEHEGLFRFRDVQQAATCLEAVAADYDRQCELARALAEEFFDASASAERILSATCP